MTPEEESALRSIRGALDFIDSFLPLYSLPVSTEALMAKLGAVPCPLSVLTASGLPEQAVFDCWGNRDGIALFDNGTRRILYNDSMPPNRVRFTLCEEMMHFFLGHTDDPSFHPLEQSYSEEDYARCEREAKGAACLVLCPPAMFLRNNPDLWQIMRSCRVSESCAASITRFYRENDRLIRRELAGRRQLGTFYTLR